MHTTHSPIQDTILNITHTTHHHNISLYKYRHTRPPEEKAKQYEQLAVAFAYYIPTSLSFLTAQGRTLYVWNALTGEVSGSKVHATASPITCCAVDDRGRFAFVGEHSGAIR
jgi:hypothetical protein